MEGPTYKGREGRGKREREVPPVITVPPGPRGARIVTDGRPVVVRCMEVIGGLGWAGSMKIDPRTTLMYVYVAHNASSRAVITQCTYTYTTVER